jgi:hypothetical protein
MTKDFWRAAVIRALHTAAQAALSFMTLDGVAVYTTGMGITEIDWLKVLSVSALAAVYSIVKSIVVGMPEYEGEHLDDSE